MRASEKRNQVKSNIMSATQSKDQRRLQDAHRRDAVRRYAQGELSWSDLRRLGINRFTQVMADLAEMGLKLPIAPLEGENAAIRKAGIQRLEKALDIQ